MLLLPAHTKDAKEMARRLCDALHFHGLTADGLNPDAEFLTLQQTQELLAKAMGHPSWRQMTAALKQPHRPIYIDGGPEDKLTIFADQLSRLLGFNYTHGSVLRTIHTSGAGFSPKWRRAMEANDSPWGPIDEQKEIAPGVVSVITPHHGGLLLSPERQAAMPAHLRLDGAAYEEDGEYNLVALGFPEEAEAMGLSLASALASVDVILRDEGAPVGEADAKEVVAYLAHCVHLNRRPVLYPSTTELEPDNQEPLPEFCFVPTIGDWIRTLKNAPRIEGKWPTLAGPWHEHWSWQARRQEQLQAHERYYEDALAQTCVTQSPGRDANREARHIAEAREYMAYLARKGAVPVTSYPAKGDVFHEVEIEGVCFRGIVSMDGPAIVRRSARLRGHEQGWVQLGVAEIHHVPQFRRDIARAAQDKPSGHAWWVCKYSACEERIRIDDLSAAGRHALAHEFGIVLSYLHQDQATIDADPDAMTFHASGWFLCYLSPAFQSLCQWVKKHPRKAGNRRGSHFGDWVEAAIAGEYVFGQD
jgi:hypothetical protein